MKTLSGIQAIVHFARLLFGWGFALLVICFKLPDVSKFSFTLTCWFISALVVAVLYSLPPRILCTSPVVKRLVFGLFIGTIVAILILSCTFIPQLGRGPMLIMGTMDVGSSRVWGIVFSSILVLGAVAGLIDFLIYIVRSNNPSDGK